MFQLRSQLGCISPSNLPESHGARRPYRRLETRASARVRVTGGSLHHCRFDVDRGPKHRNETPDPTDVRGVSSRGLTDGGLVVGVGNLLGPHVRVTFYIILRFVSVSLCVRRRGLGLSTRRDVLPVCVGVGPLREDPQ